MKTTPKRFDIVTRESLDKKDLCRFVMREGKLVFDKKQDLGGRGVYVSLKSFEDPSLERCFSKAFRTNITKQMILEAKENG